MEELLKTFGIDLYKLGASLVGAIAGIAFIPKSLTILQTIVAAVGGFGCAVYLPPVAFHYLGIVEPSNDLIGGASFLLGVVGMNLLGGAVELSRRWRKDPTLPGVSKGKKDG